MSVIKQIGDKGATIAWSPLRSHPSLLATGTKEGGGGGFDDYGGELAIHSFDLSSKSLDCNVVASVRTPQRFSSLAWGSMGNRPALRHGLIVGGMADGVVNVWDANALMNGSGDNAAVAMIERHQSAVRCAAFNPHSALNHLLAAGSSDGDISIINLDAPAQPTVASPMSGGQRLESEVTALAWNTSVTHILATATLGGTVVVWDLKENKPWCQLRDPHRASVSDVAWAPNDGLYLVTACDDDSRPVLRLWDLRSSTTTPLCEFVGHTKGVLSVDWCPHDPNLLVSCGKDAHTFIWDVQQGRAVAELPGGAGATGNGATPRQTGAGGGAGLGLGSAYGGGFSDGSGVGGFPGAPGPGAGNVFGAPAGAGGGAIGGVDALFGNTLGGIGGGAGRRYCVRWSRHLPATLAACSLDRKVTLHSAAAVGPALAAKSAMPGAAGQQAAVEATLRRAPRWLRRPVGAAFGFGGKLVTFGTPPAAVKGDLRAGAVPYAKAVHIASVATDHDFASRAVAFESSLASIEAGATDVRAFCDAKAASAAGGGDAKGSAVWGFLRLLFEPDARHHVLAYLGYDAAAVAAEVAAYAGPANMAVVKPPAAPAAAAGLDHGTADGSGSSGAHEGAGAAPGGGVDTGAHGGAGSQAGSPTVSGGLEAAAALARSQSGGNGFGGPAGWPMAHASAEDVFSGSGLGGGLAAGGAGSASAADIFGGASPTGSGASAGAGGVPSGFDQAADGTAGALPAGAAGAGGPKSGPGSTATASGSSSATAASSSSSSSSAAAVVTGGSMPDEPGVQYAKRRLPSAGDEGVLRRALLVGDFPAAVAACLAQDRLDDALLLAACGSPELWSATQAAYFARRPSPLMSVMAGIIKGELGTLVASSPLADWRETLALLCTYARADEFCGLCEGLGDRLAVEGGDAHSATLAYMAARAVSKTVFIWVAEAGAAAARVGSGPALQELVERVLIFRRAVALATGGDTTAATAGSEPGAPQPEGAALYRYIAMLANEGYLTTAATFAARLGDGGAGAADAGMGGPGSSAPDAVTSTADGPILGSVTRDRLARAFTRGDFGAPSAQALAAAVVFPFAPVNVGPAPAAAPAPAAGAYGAYDTAAIGGYDAYGNPLPPAQAQVTGYDAYGNPIYSQQPQQMQPQPAPMQQMQQQQQQAAAVGYGQHQQQAQPMGMGSSGPGSARGGLGAAAAAYGMAAPQQQQAYGAYGQQQQQQQQQQPVGYQPQQQQAQAQPMGAAYSSARGAPAMPPAAPAAPSYTTFTPAPMAAPQQQPGSMRGGLPPIAPTPTSAQQQHQQQAQAQAQQGSYGGNVGYQPAPAAPMQQQQPQQQPSTMGRITTFNPAASSMGGGGSAGGPPGSFGPGSAAGPSPVPQQGSYGMMMPPPPSMGGGQPQQQGGGMHGQHQSQHAAAPVAAAPAPPPAPLPIAPEVQTALEQLNGTIAQLLAVPLSASEQKQLQDATTSLGVITTKLQAGQVAPEASAKLVVLGGQCASYDFAGANKTQMELATVDWGRTKEWHKGVRYLTTLALVKSGGTGR